MIHAFTVRLIGIITVACLGANGTYDCNYSPYKLQAFVTNGLSKHHPCKVDADNHEPTTPVHQAFIRIETNPVNGTFWQFEEMDCDDNVLCKLYPLHQGDVIEIPGITDGNGMAAPFAENLQISWKNIYQGSNLPPPTLAADASSRALATMLIAGGTWAVKEYGDDKILITEGTLDATSNVTISIKGTNRKIIVPKEAKVDIIDFPPSLVFGSTGQHVSHAHREHFFIHYTLADPKPDVCLAPELLQMNFFMRLFRRDDFVGSLACSNSNYP